MEAYQRIIDSFHVSRQLREERIAAGTQPPIVEIATSPTFVFTANVVYLVITATLYLWMSRREKSLSEQIRPFMLAYNCICVAAAGTVCYGFIEFLITQRGDLKFVCNGLNENFPAGHRLASFFWIFHIQKFFEFADTWIFILRKSFRQVSFLHIYHHISINMVVGLSLPYAFTGDMYLPIVLNSFVHVLLYTHYLLTGLGIRSWWARHLTNLQLLQFVLIATQSYLAWTRGPMCGLHDWTKALLISYMATMVVLFGNFYIQRYISGGKARSSKSAAAAGEVCGKKASLAEKKEE